MWNKEVALIGRAKLIGAIHHLDTNENSKLKLFTHLIRAVTAHPLNYGIVSNDEIGPHDDVEARYNELYRGKWVNRKKLLRPKVIFGK